MKKYTIKIFRDPTCPACSDYLEYKISLIQNNIIIIYHFFYSNNNNLQETNYIHIIPMKFIDTGKKLIKHGYKISRHVLYIMKQNVTDYN